MLDHLSEGRFEFGMGRRVVDHRAAGGFGIDDSDLTRDMFDEVVGEFRRMWRDDEYPGHDGRSSRCPHATCCRRPYTKPHPPLWVAAGSPSTFEKAGAHGHRRALLHDVRDRNRSNR